jgi:hypothetical protein
LQSRLLGKDLLRSGHYHLKLTVQVQHLWNQIMAEATLFTMPSAARGASVFIAAGASPRYGEERLWLCLRRFRRGCACGARLSRVGASRRRRIYLFRHTVRGAYLMHNIV